MTIYYKEGGFYLQPQENAVEISEELHEKLIIGQAEGKQIVTAEDGSPILIEPRPSSYHELKNGQWSISEENQTALLNEQRTLVRDKINTLRDKKINGGVYVPAIDKWIDTDATAERNILSVKATFDLFGDQEIPWTFADNSVAMINKEKLLIIWQVLMQAKTGNHANALKHKAMVEQVENPLEYDYSSGWTQTYEDFAGAANE